MRPQKQVCDLKQALELKALGIGPSSTWNYLYYDDGSKFLICSMASLCDTHASCEKIWGVKLEMHIANAFTVSELLFMLNEDITLKASEVTIYPFLLADVLIHKLRNKELDPEEINARVEQEYANSDIWNQV